MISSPAFVLIVTLLSLSLVVGGSAISAGRGGGCDASLVRCCCDRGWALLLLLHFLSLLVMEVLVWNDNLLMLLPLESLPMLVLVELVLNWLVPLVLELELVMSLLVHRQLVVVMLQLLSLQPVLLQCW